jgi:uncharacterized repeat protein (TIGR04076 family)
MGCEYCKQDFGIAAKVARIKTKCKYHKRPGQVYQPAAFVPSGLCQELFYAVYPACLCVLYHGRPLGAIGIRAGGVKEMLVSCPAAGGTSVRVKAEEILPPLLRQAKEALENVCAVLFRPFDVHLRRVSIEITACGGNCPKKYPIGKRFFFNTHRQNELCPAGFFSLYPYLQAMESCKAAAITVHCPDFQGVVYELFSKRPSAS